jgi:hypothetical protein
VNLAIPYPVLPLPISVVKSFKAFLFLSLHFLQVLSPQVHYCTMAADSIISLLPCLLDTKPLLLKARTQLGGFVSAFTAFNARIEVPLLYLAHAVSYSLLLRPLARLLSIDLIFSTLASRPTRTSIKPRSLLQDISPSSSFNNSHHSPQLQFISRASFAGQTKITALITGRLD